MDYSSESSSGAYIAITQSSLKLKMSITTLRESFNKVMMCQANSSLWLIFWIVLRVNLYVRSVFFSSLFLSILERARTDASSVTQK